MRYSTLFIIGFAVLTLLSCSPKVSKFDLTYDTPESFSLSGTQSTRDEWWKSFDNEMLNMIVDSALSSNYSLEATWSQISQARALIRQSRSSLFPQVDLQVRSGIQRPQPDFVGGENTQFSLGAGYEVDLWGRIRYGLHAQRYRAEASLQDYKTAAISLAGEICLTWFRINATVNQLNLIENQISTNRKVLALIRARFASGQVKGVDILRQKQLIESTRQQKVQLEAQLAVFKNQLSSLLGVVPGNIDHPDSTKLPELPPLPETGVPLDLVNRRPDVLSAFNLLQASDREVAVAISNRYPRLNFNLLGAIRSNTFDNLLQSQAVSLTGGILAPLFYGGRLAAELDEAEALRKQRVEEYRQVVLNAFQEVENALIREAKLLDRINIIEEQVNLAERTYGQLRIEYLNGSIEYLDVLTALNQEQQLRRDLISIKLNLLETRVALYRALAGGFETEREQNSS